MNVISDVSTQDNINPSQSKQLVSYLQRATTPPSLFYAKFPTPYLPRDPNFNENFKLIFKK
ncbi:hypothetical protein BpHYR1_024852 [Brachionus plicatilis]|uniref:Uncharacterized protein n=1 Tax=Brachionus plicatilis TaxID=10195 RepID=A0A3M7QVH8_BRAPC|nr:hypothetical protein BpHYR1_024852 [Brachionus plicatilis]